MANYITNGALLCPHCGARGKVQTRPSKRKAGLSGGKVVAGFLTMGVSLITPGVGLSRKEKITEARCAGCGSEWIF